MSTDVSNLGPDFDESALLALAVYHESVANAWKANSTTAATHRASAATIRAAIAAYDTLRDRCLLAEVRAHRR